MGVYIKGMEMPEHCIDCPFMVSHENDDCILQSNAANESFRSWEQMKAGCPLAPVSPHGRLIDADAMEYKMLYKEIRMCGTGVEALGVWKSDIDAAPTIIEAEEGEE